MQLLFANYMQLQYAVSSLFFEETTANYMQLQYAVVSSKKFFCPHNVAVSLQ